MKKYIIIVLIISVLVTPAFAYAEELPEPTPIETPAPTPEMTQSSLEVPEQASYIIATPTPAPTPYLYEYDTGTIVGQIASIMGVQQAENTPQNIAQAIPYLLRIAINVGVVWFIFSMIKSFSVNIFGRSRGGK